MAVWIETSIGQQADANGIPLSGGSVTVYAAGTTTPLSLYSDPSLSVSAANPVTLDAEGRHDMRYIATAAYKILVKNSAGAQVYERDNIDPGVAIGSGALPIANGGTGATVAANALTNLGAAAAGDVATLEADVAALQTWAGYNLTTQTRIATGTTGQQPAGTEGSLRSNTTTDRLEWRNDTGWQNVLTEGDATVDELSNGIFLLQRDRDTSLNDASVTTTTPAADTSIPQITEGEEILSLTFTPVSATSVLRIQAFIRGGCSSISTIVVAALFNGDANAIAADVDESAGNANSDVFLHLRHEYSPGGTGAITFSVRCGVSGGTMTLPGSGQTLGGNTIRRSELIVEEWTE